MKRLRFFPEKCTTCKQCELACSAVKESVFDPGLARLHIHGHYTGDDLIVDGSMCNMCMLCVNVCPCGAIQIGPHGLQFLAEYCSKCGVCVVECPKGVITQRPDGFIRLCDHCGGDPQCVAWCPKDALVFEGEE